MRNIWLLVMALAMTGCFREGRESDVDPKKSDAKEYEETEGYTYIQAGAWLCDSPFGVMQQALYNKASANIGATYTYQGCEIIGADTVVNVLRKQNMPGPAVLVGNTGGTAWVAPEYVKMK